jgi:hypothetical protein
MSIVPKVVPTTNRDPFDIHPKVTAAGIGGGLALVVAGIFAFVGIPAPEWVAPIVTLVAALLAGYLKAS